MEFNEYQEKALSTANYPVGCDVIGGTKPNEIREGVYISLNEQYLALGLASEVGEVLDKIKKGIRDNQGIVPDEEAILLELGDVLWYIANLATVYDATLQDIAELNITKLQSRKERNVIGGSGDNR